MTKYKNFLVSSLLVLISLGLALGILETYFRLFYDETDSLSATLSHQRWWQRHWKPLNKMGFRDIEHDAVALKGKKVIFIVGDSLAAGVGIKDHRDRFTDILRKDLPPDWELVLVARPGWDTEQQLEFLTGYDVRPDIVVLAYYINDIKRAAKKEGLYKKILVNVPDNRFLRLLLRKSHLFDYVFYRTGIFKFFNSTMERGFNELLGYYGHEKAWKNHIADFEDMIMYCRQKRSRLIVLIFPHFSAIQRSKGITQKVAQAFGQRGIEVYDLSTKFEGWKSSDLTVNKNDAHPNKKVHAEVARMLLPIITGSDSR